VLLAAFGSLRWGELAALRRCDVDVEHGTIRVERSLTELAGGGRMFGPPKSTAGRRVVVVPAVIRPALADDLERFTARPPGALVFTSPTGAPLRDGNFRRRVWGPALARAGLSSTHFHDLRHTGNTLDAVRWIPCPSSRTTRRDQADRCRCETCRFSLTRPGGAGRTRVM
jgi:integrase